MERSIEHGCTVLTVKKKVKEVPGISRYGQGRFRVDMQYNHKKYLIGIFDSYQDAVTARKVAEKKAAAGILPQWLASCPHGNSPDYWAFWKAALKTIEQENE